MIASLGMYDMPAIQPANDRFWALIRAHLRFGPSQLSRERDPWALWQSPDLLLAQTCGMPYRTRLYQTVALIGTPDYGVTGCPPGYYNSVLVVRADAPEDRLHDFSGGTFAYNEPMSQSGWAAPMVHLNALGVSVQTLTKTGAHAASAKAVADGRADMAALDVVTWTLLQEHDPVAQQLKVIGTTTPTPGLPLITARGRDTAPLATAVRAAIHDLTPKDRAALHLRGLIDIPQATYLAVPTPPSP
ncbi:phosphate/phosphite/phosphonate ABC transporter substrate-binding protein [Sedimentitalea todarodis]|uniref:PhnD/SsuA/transferrin family substrate-binding protein n=1 Tax=Sedimentitalea todarodis TaxID=1631240 RepID=A0ABU3VF68_9RHOB|nr:PhnD/SsuA/transferrin family substrate-binding protein [Sedimentitalea todarodis]MDU9004827.1 PhnD/SsuA/transferrin family substrate-binding protein [Sedimentitalea todarodis]